MIRTSTWLVAAGQASLWLGIAICYFAAPSLVHEAEGGVSNYGVYRPTVIPYTFAFTLAALATLLAGYVISRHSSVLSTLFYILAALYIAVLVSTYSYRQSQAYRDLHIILGSTLYIVQFLASLWLVWRIHPALSIWALFMVQIAGSLLSLASLLNIAPLLLVGQAITAVSFGISLIMLVWYTPT